MISIVIYLIYLSDVLIVYSRDPYWTSVNGWEHVIRDSRSLLLCACFPRPGLGTMAPRLGRAKGCSVGESRTL